MNKHPLRKSCSFCRARKIKCSNETICEACRKQNVDCVYDFEPYRPSDSSNSQSPPRVHESINVQTDDRVGRATQRRRTLSPRAGSMNPDGDVSPGSTPSSEDIGPELEAMFTDNFLTEGDGARSSSWQRKISSLHRSVGSLSNQVSESWRASASSQSSQYASVFSSITEDLVGSVIGKFGNLGCHQIEGGGSRFFVNGLKRDDTASMFDAIDSPGDQDSNILVDYGSRKISQMVDAWFFSHPLSLLISKTLLIHDLRAGTHDEVLLAVMLADASSFIGDETAAVHTQSLLSLATCKLRKQVLDISTAPRSFSPQSASHKGISTSQALLLLGWNALCRSQIRRATCYIRLATQQAAKIMTQKWGYNSNGAGGRVNGIEVSEVIRETIAYLWCISFTLSLWLQTQVHEHPDLPHDIPASAFLPIDSTSSVLIRLDEASDNVSTLQRQKSALGDIWPLTHLSTVIAHLYALYPKDAQPWERPENRFWQELTLIALQRIQDPSRPQNLDSVCREIYRVLMENARLVNGEISHTPSRALVVVVYHTIGIHVLFPRRNHEQLELEHSDDVSLTPELIDRFCASAEEIHDTLATLHRSLDTGPFAMVSTQLHPSSPELFILALDSCARAISAICSQQGRTRRSHGFDIFTYYKPKLESLAIRLFTLADDQFFCPRSSLHKVRKRLKQIIETFGHSYPSSSWTRRTNSESSSSPMSGSSITPSDMDSMSRVTSAPPSGPGLYPVPTTMTASTRLPDEYLQFELPIGQTTGGSSTLVTEGGWEGGAQSQASLSHPPSLLNHVADTSDILTLDVGDEGHWFQSEQMMMDINLSTSAELNMPRMMYS
ncbi:hypothetical protein GGS20DRAFT_558531 [Poronia punctata]|nr:hypothetical protein GGS20DRAFT_558531 [Poronia punctata]